MSLTKTALILVGLMTVFGAMRVFGQFSVPTPITPTTTAPIESIPTDSTTTPTTTTTTAPTESTTPTTTTAPTESTTTPTTTAPTSTTSPTGTCGARLKLFRTFTLLRLNGDCYTAGNRGGQICVQFIDIVAEVVLLSEHCAPKQYCCVATLLGGNLTTI